MKLRWSQYSLSSTLRVMLGVAVLAGAYVLGRTHASWRERSAGYEAGANQVRQFEMPDLLDERDRLKEEVSQLREYSMSVVDMKLKEFTGKEAKQ